MNYIHKGWIVEDLKKHTPAEAAKLHHERCERLLESVKAEFQSRHSAMSPQGAKAYADNWN